MAKADCSQARSRICSSVICSGLAAIICTSVDRLLQSCSIRAIDRAIGVWSSFIALSSPMLRCRTRLLPSGSKERFCHARALIFVMAVRGAHLFAPYQGLSGWTARPPAPGQPARPLLRDDPDDIRQVAAALATAFLDGHQPKPGCLPNGVLNHPA